MADCSLRIVLLSRDCPQGVVKLLSSAFARIGKGKLSLCFKRNGNYLCIHCLSCQNPVKNLSWHPNPIYPVSTSQKVLRTFPTPYRYSQPLLDDVQILTVYFHNLSWCPNPHSSCHNLSESVKDIPHPVQVLSATFGSCANTHSLLS